MHESTGVEDINSCPYEDNTCSNDDRPTIVISGDQLLEVHVKQGVDALIKWNYPTTVFQMSGRLVELVQEKKNIYKIDRIKYNSLKLLLAEAAEWIVFKPDPDDKTKWVPKNVYPTDPIVGAIFDTSEKWKGIPFLNGLINTPIPRKDGSIVTKYGYDEITGYYYTPGLKVEPIDDSDLSQEWAKQSALFLMKELFSDFPLKDDASKANMLAALITPILRPYTGRPPLCAITKPTSGQGASLLIDIISLVSFGIAASTKDANIPNESEMQKILTGILSTGKSFVALDNLDQNNKFKSPTCARALTSDFISGRILGHSDVPDFFNNLCWFLTGRNVKLAGDLPRRTALIEMYALPKEILANPEQREFRHTDIKTWTLENRSDLVYFILLMFRAWILAGKPKAKTPIIPSFETWSEVIGGILEYAGIEGFLGNKQIVDNDMNTESDEWFAFAKAWYNNPTIKGYVSARVVYDAITNSPIMQDALPEEVEKVLIKEGKPNIRGLGRKLESMKDVLLDDGLTIRVKRDEHLGILTYCLEKNKK